MSAQHGAQYVVWGRPAPLAGSIMPLSEPLCRQLSSQIHDQVLQALGVSMLQAELCRRLWRAGKEQQAMAELDGVLNEIESAVDVLREILAELRAAESPQARTA